MGHFSGKYTIYWSIRTDTIDMFIHVRLQRATLAEKEVSALKEQLAAANEGNSKTEGHKLSQTPQGSDQQQVHDASNPRRTPNTNLEQELQAKDKEVSLAQERNKEERCEFRASS